MREIIGDIVKKIEYLVLIVEGTKIFFWKRSRYFIWVSYGGKSVFEKRKTIC